MTERPQQAASKKKWGMTPDQWAEAKREAESLLLERARNRSTVTYSELCRAITAASIQPRSWALVALLDEICSEEDDSRGIVLATLVVRADSGRPGEGYFAWAEREGRDVSDREAFWKREAEAVWASFGGEG